ncbi:MAG: tetratricopeptide repeat protein, partial [Bryobacteraceae bacterium]
VLTPSLEPKTSDIRHAYLHYLLDPPSVKYSDLILKKKALADYAIPAPALDDSYKADFLLLTTESLIKAVESRFTRGAARDEIVSRALSEGFILTPHFAEQLPAFEKQEQSMRLYFPEMVKAIDLKREDKRLEKVQFAAAVKVRKAKTVAVAPPPEPTGAYKTMEDAENLYEKRELDRARALYTRILQETDEKPLHAKSYYGLARIAILQKDPELAERLFQKSLESSPEPYVKAWVLVYLGKLAHASGDQPEAVKRFKEAMAVEGASRAARGEAEKGIAVQ